MNTSHHPLHLLSVILGLLITATAFAGPGTEPSFAGCGLLQSGPQGCPTFQADNGTNYFIANTGSYFPGARVYVEGTIAMAPLCQPFPPVLSIIDNTITDCFMSCGRIVQTAPCIVFEADNGIRYQLEDTGGFSLGDDVWVSGVVVNGCPSLCTEPTRCLRDVTIDRCIRTCGRLSADPGCNAIITDEGELLGINDPGGFNDGDEVFVTGSFSGPCANLCDIPCIGGNTIGSCYKACGYLVKTSQGLRFISDDGQNYGIDNTGNFGMGARVYVEGELLAPCFDSPGGVCISRNTIEPCFSKCGVLAGITQGCALFEFEDGEILGVENLDTTQFPSNKRYYISGKRLENFLQFCFPYGGPGVADNVIGPCFSGCGRIEAGAECPLFVPDNGGGARYRLENTGGLSPGDRAWVEGILDPASGCVDFCQQGDACVRYNTIRRLHPADINCDGSVGFADLLRVLVAWGPCPDAQPCPADIDGDGRVGQNDVIAVLDGWTG